MPDGMLEDALASEPKLLKGPLLSGILDVSKRLETLDPCEREKIVDEKPVSLSPYALSSKLRYEGHPDLKTDAARPTAWDLPPGSDTGRRVICYDNHLS